MAINNGLDLFNYAFDKCNTKLRCITVDNAQQNLKDMHDILNGTTTMMRGMGLSFSYVYMMPELSLLVIEDAINYYGDRVTNQDVLFGCHNDINNLFNIIINLMSPKTGIKARHASIVDFINTIIDLECKYKNKYVKLIFDDSAVVLNPDIKINIDFAIAKIESLYKLHASTYYPEK